MSDYTPTTDGVRSSYCFESADADPTWQRDVGAEFDRWLTAERARIWDEAVSTALDHAIRNDDGVTLRLEKSNPYRKEEDQ